MLVTGIDYFITPFISPGHSSALRSNKKLAWMSGLTRTANSRTCERELEVDLEIAPCWLKSASYLAIRVHQVK